MAGAAIIVSSWGGHSASSVSGMWPSMTRHSHDVVRTALKVWLLEPPRSALSQTQPFKLGCDEVRSSPLTCPPLSSCRERPLGQSTLSRPCSDAGSGGTRFLRARLLSLQVSRSCNLKSLTGADWGQPTLGLGHKSRGRWDPRLIPVQAEPVPEIVKERQPELAAGLRKPQHHVARHSTIGAHRAAGDLA